MSKRVVSLIDNLHEMSNPIFPISGSNNQGSKFFPSRVDCFRADDAWHVEYIMPNRKSQKLSPL